MVIFQGVEKGLKCYLASLVLGTQRETKLLKFSSLVFSFLKSSAKVPLIIKTKEKKRHWMQ
jgi:hypothetical protein